MGLIQNATAIRLLFICGSLEPGKDGVGDYTRRLAVTLKIIGHDVSIVAANDRFVDKTGDENQDDNGTTIKVLRIADFEQELKRRQLITSWVNAFNPTWISLQFVIFSFHKKGLPFHLSNLLFDSTKGRMVHLMFHELWVVRDFSISVKLWLLGTVQKEIIKRLIKRLKPSVIHTQTYLYQEYLQRIGASVRYLPLFSNIPVIQNLEYSCKYYNLGKAKKITFVVFGTIHANSMFKEFAREARIFSQKRNVYVSLLLVGRSGPVLGKWISICKSEGLDISVVGEKSVLCISNLLLESTIGLTTTPYALAEKSGSVAAMLEHGLPVLCIAQPWLPKGIKKLKEISGITQYIFGDLHDYLQTNKVIPVKNRVLNVAQELLAALHQARIDRQ